MQVVVDVVTAVAALGGFAAGLWNGHLIGKVTARVDALERAHNAHVNAAGLHAR